MKLKNTDELRRRAKAHRRLRNYQALTYGTNAENGDPAEIQACAIGCLAAPHQKSRFKALMKRIGTAGMWNNSDERDRLRSEFGISHALSELIERGFEGGADAGRTEDDRAAFVIAVTEAMADDVELPRLPRFGNKDEWMTENQRKDFLVWLSAKCGRPVPAYARAAGGA